MNKIRETSAVTKILETADVIVYQINSTPVQTVWVDSGANLSQLKTVDPTRIDLLVNSNRPFNITFAESFDGNWRATVVNSNGTTLEISNPQEYDEMNRFAINSTGQNLNIELRYLPQDWFEFSLLISVVSWICILLYTSLKPFVIHDAE